MIEFLSVVFVVSLYYNRVSMTHAMSLLLSSVFGSKVKWLITPSKSNRLISDDKWCMLIERRNQSFSLTTYVVTNCILAFGRSRLRYLIENYKELLICTCFSFLNFLMKICVTFVSEKLEKKEWRNVARRASAESIQFEGRRTWVRTWDEQF